MKHIAEFAGARISLDYSDGVTIVLRWRLGQANQLVLAGLGEVLGGFGQFSCLGGDCEAKIPYTDKVDERSVALVDLLVAIRYAHPRATQLRLDLSPQEQAELAEVMRG